MNATSRLRFLFVLALLGLPAAAYADIKPKIAASCRDTADPSRCEERRNRLVTLIPAAMKGDYMAQREVGFCLATGCRGAIAADLVQACAWFRLITVNRGADATDRANLRNYCGPLDESQRSGADTAADALSQHIYKRRLSN